MAGIALCEPHCLYNIVSQKRRVSRLAEANYLCLLDARTQHEYNESHIITARRIEQSPTGEYLVPDSEELRCVRYCVVYDCETSSLDCCDCEEEEKEKGSSPSLETENTDSSSVCSQNAEEGSAIQHARALEQFTRHPVLILRGGYKRFSACYHFLRTQKILWMPQQELDNFQPYPVEILPEKLYMGNFKQACDQQIQRNLKIKAQVNISEQPATLHDHSAQSGNAIAHSEKSSGISQGNDQNKVTNAVSYPRTCISRHFSCLWLQRKTSKVSAPWVIFQCPLNDMLSHFGNSSPVFCSISSLTVEGGGCRHRKPHEVNWGAMSTKLLTCTP
ncbi:serine/threonine/tyrosine-interacting-like protein 1 isoform X1 [Falco biarmicus]|uniref:serine/threonine/tyrosine-interacting-like protein 1 isoform X1 n=1 Tax=Falco rusticolus TaxID=120794 RepID=UPI001886886C|nr:serine/threonine/tyrosine-interacting-like protein 1 isoform X1 [Falco rusticolus]XP_056185783.1 serine/threonine/tyrosine-interacting-like protein 1 isoform X1 [Falco biarmicus]